MSVADARSGDPRGRVGLPGPLAWYAHHLPAVWHAARSIRPSAAPSPAAPAAPERVFTCPPGPAPKH